MNQYLHYSSGVNANVLKRKENHFHRPNVCPPLGGLDGGQCGGGKGFIFQGTAPEVQPVRLQHTHVLPLAAIAHDGSELFSKTLRGRELLWVIEFSSVTRSLKASPREESPNYGGQWLPGRK